MAAYIHDQSIINERRMKEMEAQVKASEEAAAAASVAAVPAIVEPISPSENTSNLIIPSATTNIDTVVASALETPNKPVGT